MHTFDLNCSCMTSSRPQLKLPHFSVYAVSLLVCFTALFLMKKAQPALIYIVPLTLVPMVLVSLIRGEFKEFWEGDKDHHRQRSHQDGEEQEEQQQVLEWDALGLDYDPRCGVTFTKIVPFHRFWGLLLARGNAKLACFFNTKTEDLS